MTQMRYGLAGRTILITGGASGIGRSIALAAAQDGARVAIVDAVAERLEATATELRETGAEVVTEVLDVRDEPACEAVMEKVERALGELDGMVACAGISSPAQAIDMADEDWLRCIDVNLNGLFYSVRAAGRRMVKRRRGAIVTIASVDGLGGHAGRSHYTASKHGVVGLTRALAIEWGRFGVRVNAVAPGVVDTPLVRANLPSDHVQYAMVDRIPLGRLADAPELAGPTLFLLSSAASYINGTTLAVDGGISAGYFTRWSGADLGSKALFQQGVYDAPGSKGFPHSQEQRDALERG